MIKKEKFNALPRFLLYLKIKILLKINAKKD